LETFSWQKRAATLASARRVRVTKLHVNGTAAGTSWTNLSSREYKSDVAELPAAAAKGHLEALMKLKRYTYKYKAEFGGDGQEKLGFVAEELPKEVLSADGKGVDVYELLTFTIGAMQEQQRQIDDLKKACQ
jgi:hypothetical protein